MIISSRTQMIIQYLSRNNNHYVTVKDIAEKLGLTERTVYRELPEVNQVLDFCGIELESAVGKGMKLYGTSSNMKKLKKLLDDISDNGFSVADRVAIILFALLHEGNYVKTQALALESKTSVQTVRSDLKIIANRLSKEKLTLIVKKSEGVRIDGTEIDKNHYFVKILAQYIDIDVLFNWIMDGKDRGQPLLQLMNNHGYHEIAEKVFDINMNLFKKYNIKVNDNSLRDMLLLVTLFLKYKKRSDYSQFLSVTESSRQETMMTNELTDSLEKSFDINFSEQETAYFRWLVSIIVGQPKEMIIDSAEIDITYQVTRLIAEIERRLGLKLDVDKKFITGLADHMNRTLTRIRSGMIISNPINKEIEQNYRELFKVVHESTVYVFPNIIFPDEEIGYLVLYVALALDQIAAKSFRVLVVCSSGMGSSKLLATRLEREIAEIKIQKLIALVELYSENLDDYDLIISTVPLQLENNENYIMVSPLLTETEAEEVKQRIRRHRIKKLSKITTNRKVKTLKNQGDIIDALKKVQAISTWGVSIMDNLLVFTALGMQTDLTKAISSLIYRIKMVDDPDLLIKHTEYNNGCFVIPGTQLAYSEFCMREIETPALLIIKLDKKQSYLFGDIKLTNLVSMVALLYPRWQEPHYIDFLHDIALMIMEDIDCVEAFEKGDEKTISTILGTRIMAHLAQNL